MDANFLIQKTPSLDLLFFERTKILPTLHVVIVRHPLVSNALRFPMMQQVWLVAYNHVFKLLNQDMIDWYAVVSYESLIQYNDAVVQELIEVVRSGMRRYSDERRTLGKRENNLKSKSSEQRSTQRRLHMRKRDKSQKGSFLIPKETSWKIWKECLKKRKCQQLTKHLTDTIYPYFGWVSVSREGEVYPLSSKPGLVTVDDGFDHVLFSSEGDALRELRHSRGNTVGAEYIGSKPPSDLIAEMSLHNT